MNIFNNRKDAVEALDVELEIRRRRQKEYNRVLKLTKDQLLEEAEPGSLAERVLCEQSFGDFVARAFKYIDSKEYIREWFVDFLCRALEETFLSYKEGKKVNSKLYNRLNVNVVPGALKSTVFSVCANAWLWTRDPSIGVLTCTYVDENAKRDSIKTRDLIRSEWYQNHWGHVFRITKDTEKYFKNNKFGYRSAFSLNSRGITGKRGDFLILDDLLSAGDVFSRSRKETINWTIDNVVMSRLNDPEKSVIIHSGQRVCEGDPSENFIKKGFNSIVLPMEFNPDKKCVTHFGEDIRTKKNEILSIRETEESLREKKQTLGSFGTAAQLQQEPIPIGGGIIKTDWFKRYRVVPSGATYYWSWDFAVKVEDINDYTAGLCVAMHSTGFYIVDLVHQKMKIHESINAVKDAYNSTAVTPSGIAIEDKANGSPIIHELQRKGNDGKPLPIIPIIPGQKDKNKKYTIIPSSKYERVGSVSPICESGVIYLPENAPWVLKFLEEVTMFPNGLHDDICDAFCQIILWLHHKKSSRGATVFFGAVTM